MHRGPRKPPAACDALRSITPRRHRAPASGHPLNGLAITVYGFRMDYGASFAAFVRQKVRTARARDSQRLDSACCARKRATKCRRSASSGGCGASQPPDMERLALSCQPDMREHRLTGRAAGRDDLPTRVRLEKPPLVSLQRQAQMTLIGSKIAASWISGRGRATACDDAGSSSRRPVRNKKHGCRRGPAARVRP